VKLPVAPYREHLILAARACAGALREARALPAPPFTAPLPGAGWHVRGPGARVGPAPHRPAPGR
jgi:hypothetical protein